MNPDTPKTPREELELRLTALLMGELPPAEAAALEAQIASDAGLTALLARLRQAAELARAASVLPDAAPSAEPARLSPERRERLLAHFKTIAPPIAAARSRRDWSWVVPLGLAAMLIALIGGGLMMPTLTHVREKASREPSSDFVASEGLLGAERENVAWDSQLGMIRRYRDQSASSETLYRDLSAPVTAPSIEIPQFGTNSFAFKPAPPSPTPAPPGIVSAVAASPTPAQSPSAGISVQKLAETATSVVMEQNRSATSGSAPTSATLSSGGVAGGGGISDPVRFAGGVTLGTANGRANIPEEKKPAAEDTLAQNRWYFGNQSQTPSIAPATPAAAEPGRSDPAVSFDVRAPADKDADGRLPMLGGQPTVAFNDLGELASRAESAGSKEERFSRSVDEFTRNRGSTPAPAAAGQMEFYSDFIAPESLAKTGAGKTPLRGNSTFSGATTISAGRPTIAAADGLTVTGNSTLAIENRTKLYARAGVARVAEADHQEALAAGKDAQNEVTASSAKPSDAFAAAPMPAGVQKREQEFTLGSAETINPAKFSTPAVTRKMVTDGEATREGKANEPALSAISATTAEKLVEEEVGKLSEKTRQLASRGKPAVESPAKPVAAVVGERFELVTKAVPKLPKLQQKKQIEDEMLALKAVPPAAIPQPEVQTSENAFSTFSLNVSDVSFKLAAASLEQGKMPEPATVRSEEFINAFDYRDPEPAAGAALACATERARYPFAQNRDLFRCSVKTAAAGRQPGRALNIVLLLDNSGSMERADRVAIVREALRVLAAQLQPQDKLSILSFARTPRLWADGVAGDKAPEACARVGEITPQGGTNIAAALDLGYQTALQHYAPGSINRVVMLTDGAANLGNVNPEALKHKVEAHRRQGVALDCFGIGWEGLNDDLLEQLTRNGDGRYGFINSPEEAATEFAGQLAGALRVAASDVKVQIEFNPRRVTAYRQIGYAKHQLTKEQFRDNTGDAAEIGAAESGNALYVLEVNPRGAGDVATVRVRYKVPGTADYREMEWPVPFTGPASALEQASPALRLAGTASAFSEMLAGSPFAAEVTSDALLGLVNGVPAAFTPDPRPQRLEWMIRTAKSISGR